MKVEIRSRFSFDTTKCKGVECTFEESKTQPQFKDECDINYLLRHYNDVPRPEPIFGDCTQYKDLQHCMDIINAAGDDFMSLPSDIRSRFNHDPVEFFNFCNDSNNVSELVSMGLATNNLDQSLDITGPSDTKSSPNNSEVNTNE